MNRSNIETIVKDLAKQAINGYRENYKTMYDIHILAEGYWENRTEEEVERDTCADVGFNDYFNWCWDAMSLIQATEKEQA